MIQVDEVSDGVFQVVFTDEHLQTLSVVAARKVQGRDYALCGLLTFVVDIYDKVEILERNRDGLD